MKPVARITPAAKALTIKKISLSGRRAGIFFPKIGRETPSALAMSIEVIATSLNCSALALSLFSVPVSLPVHSAATRRGRRSRKQKRITFFMARERERERMDRSLEFSSVGIYVKEFRKVKGENGDIRKAKLEVVTEVRTISICKLNKMSTL